MKMNFQYLLFYFFTFGVDSIYRLKLVFNQVIFYFLVFITAAAGINYETTEGGFYAGCSVFIVILLVLETRVRSHSPYFLMIDCVVLPYNGKTGIARNQPYNRFDHIKSLVGFLLIDTFKILSAVYCMIIIIRLDEPNAIVSYIVLCMLYFESLLGVMIYLLSILCLIFNPLFFKKWLKWMCKRYHSRTAEYEITLENGILSLEIRQVKNKQPSPLQTSV